MFYSTRRYFLSTVTKLGALIVASPLVKPILALAADLQLIDMSEKKRTDAANKTAVGIAKNFKYIADANKEKRENASEKKDAGGKAFKPTEQFCHNCNFFDTTKSVGKNAPCQVIPGVLVHNEGWCMMWTPKAKS